LEIDQTAEAECSPGILCEMLAPALAEPLGPSIEPCDYEPVHLEENLTWVSDHVEVVVPSPDDRIDLVD